MEFEPTALPDVDPDHAAGVRRCARLLPRDLGRSASSPPRGIDAEVRAGQPQPLGAAHAARAALSRSSRPQGKLVRVTRGEVFDVAVDMRRSSPTLRPVGRCDLLGESNRQMLWVPPGFAHGFLVLSESADFLYKCTDFYAPQHERAIRWNDPDIGIDWPLPAGVAAPALGARMRRRRGSATRSTFREGADHRRRRAGGPGAGCRRARRTWSCARWRTASWTSAIQRAVRRPLRRFAPGCHHQCRRLHGGRQGRDRTGAARSRQRRRAAIPRARRRASAGARLIHISTDYRLRRQAVRPYAPDAATNPLSVYGHTKLAGEQAVQRDPAASAPSSCAPPGSTPPQGSNFLLTMLRLMSAQRRACAWWPTSAARRPRPPRWPRRSGRIVASAGSSAACCTGPTRASRAGTTSPSRLPRRRAALGLAAGGRRGRSRSRPRSIRRRRAGRAYSVLDKRHSLQRRLSSRPVHWRKQPAHGVH